MKSRKSSPTRPSDRKKIVLRPIVERRVKPEIWVRTMVKGPWGMDSRFHKASLRTRRGYIYLQWREGEHVRSHYLGKAPKSCPTDIAPGPPAGARSSARSRRVKK